MFYLLWITALLFASPVRGEVSSMEIKADSLQLLVQAGDSCMRQYNTFEALKHYQQAFDMADTYEVRTKLADCYYKRGNYRETADLLKEKEKCDVVICLSHIGTLQTDGVPCDSVLISNSRNIDLVIGGHTHQLFENHKVTNLNGDSILSVQMLKSGIYTGKIKLEIQAII
mgnify:CR=1 FL=1